MEIPRKDTVFYTTVTAHCSEFVEYQRVGTKTLMTAAASSTNHAARVVSVDMGLQFAAALDFIGQNNEALELATAFEFAASYSNAVVKLKRKFVLMHELDVTASASKDFESALQLYTKALKIDPAHVVYCAKMLSGRTAANMWLKRYASASRMRRGA